MEVLAEFESSLSDPLLYLEPSGHLSEICLRGVKSTFDLCKLHGEGLPTGPLTELYTEGFDNDQIWEELQLMNEPALKRLGKLVKSMSAWKNAQLLPGRECEDENGSEKSLVQSDHDSVASAESEEVLPVMSRQRRVVKKASVVDDRFFKLSEMEEFLEQVERGEERDTGSDSERDLFADTESEDEARDAHYDEFFDPPSDGVEDSTENNVTENDGTENDVTENDVTENDGTEDDGTEDDGDYSDAANSDGEVIGVGVKSEEERRQFSTHEKKQLKLRRHISSLETANMKEKEWQLTGEVGAKGRPINSLLEEDLGFDHMTRPPPVITEDTTTSLEGIIKQRILDEAWDDVERKTKPVEKPYDYSRSRPLDQEKSKLSLAEVYEQEYIKQTQALESDRDNERHVEIRERMNKLFVKLDALSNFHFTPKPPKPEVKIVSSVPALSLEEVAPVATSDAALLAPEELQTKPGREEKGVSEKTATDRKRERRLKKLHKRQKLSEQRLVKKLRPGLGNKYSKRSLVKQLKDRGREEVVDRTLKSSSKFFARLQEEVREQVKAGKAVRGSGKGKTHSGQQYKL